MVARELLTKSKVASSTGTEARSALGAMSVVCDATLILCTDDCAMTWFVFFERGRRIPCTFQRVMAIIDFNVNLFGPRLAV